MNSDESFVGDSDSEIQFNITGSKSLREEFASIKKTYSSLKNFVPEKKKGPGRPTRKPRCINSSSQPTPSTLDSPPSKKEESINGLLESILQFNEDLLTRVEKLESDNGSLRSQLRELASISPSSRNLTNNLRLESSEQSVIPEHSGSITIPPPRPTFAEIVAAPINVIEGKLDRLEQDSLSSTLKIDGPACQEIVSDFINKKILDLKSAVKNKLNSFGQEIIKENCIEEISILGKERKHLKVRVSKVEDAIGVIKLVKSKKPTNLFISNYLTKNRANLLYKIRNLKRENSNIESGYIYKGNIFCKIVNKQRASLINSLSDLNDLVQSLE